MNKLLFLALIICLESLVSDAQDAYGNCPERSFVSLQSAAGHGGSNVWLMNDISTVSTNGALISLPSYSPLGWSNAIVPGTVLNSLIANGTYPEAYFGTNNYHGSNYVAGQPIPDLYDKGSGFYTYWFTTKFTVPSNYIGQRVWLQLDGVNYKADIWLNGQKLGSMAGMFNRGLFDITDVAMVASSQNRLAILVYPITPPNGFIPTGTTGSENVNGGDGKIGASTTMLMSAGWDFTFKDGIRDRNTGIWRDIKLFSTGPVLVRNPFVTTSLPLPNTNSAQETILVELSNATAQAQTGILRAVIAETGVSIEQTVTLEPNEQRQVTFTPSNYPALTIANPQLWWPLNKGTQFLYHLNLRFTQNGLISDQLQTRFAVREIRSDQNTTNKARIFYVNGKRLFLHGANWIPEAMCRTSEERTAAELRYTQQAGVNFLRLWAGGVAESDQFFDLCDQYGILVWLEFWQTGNTIMPTDSALYRTNVTDTVKRLRNHPSLAYYVSANERYLPKIVPVLDIITSLDGTRGYQDGSEDLGIHDGSPYVSCNPMWYYEDTASSRGSRIYGLCPEYGCPILPTIDGLREMMAESDLWPINKPIWNYLDGAGFHGMTTDYLTSTTQYGGSQSIEEYAMKAQMFGGLCYKSIWECWNANRFEYGDRFCTGLLFWYLNSGNRQTCGRMWDWSLEPTAALYFTQKAHEPVHVQYDFIKNTVSVNNELPQAYAGLTVTARILNMDMSEAYRGTASLNLSADAFVTNVLSVKPPAGLSSVHFIKLSLTDAAGKLLSDNFYWRSTNSYIAGRTLTGPLYQGMSAISHMSKVTLTSTVTQVSQNGKNYYKVQVTNPTNAPTVAFMVWLRLQSVEDSKPIRPAFYEDNFFSLLPGESRSISIEYSTNINSGATKLLIDGWNVARQQYQNGTYTSLPDIHSYLPPLENLGQSKPVAASSSTSGHDPKFAVDTDTSTRWSSGYSNNQWIMIDLGSPQKFNQVELNWETAYGSEYKIQVTDDTNYWTDILHVVNGRGGDEILTMPLVTSRYVRLFGIQRGTVYGFSLWNFAVYLVPHTPAAPSALEVYSTSSHQIALAWTDNSTNESGFEINRKIGPAGTYKPLPTVGANITQYIDSDVSSGAVYYYKVRAINADGNSDFSPEVSLDLPSELPFIQLSFQDLQPKQFGFFVHGTASSLVEASTSLVDALWVPIYTNTALGTYFFFDTNLTKYSSRFYRVHVQ